MGLLRDLRAIFSGEVVAIDPHHYFKCPGCGKEIQYEGGSVSLILSSVGNKKYCPDCGCLMLVEAPKLITKEGGEHDP
jgi:predicted RNA-binding Zn-ribbon protein involved in translation (DUF1610 family)